MINNAKSVGEFGYDDYNLRREKRPLYKYDEQMPVRLRVLLKAQ